MASLAWNTGPILEGSGQSADSVVIIGSVTLVSGYCYILTFSSTFSGYDEAALAKRTGVSAFSLRSFTRT